VLRSTIGTPISSASRPSSCEQMPLLGPDAIGLSIRNVTIVATFDTTKPTNTRLRLNVRSAIQPATMSRTREGVYTRLVHGDRMAGHSDKHEISVRRVIPRAASYRTAVIRRFVTRICHGARRFVLHDMIVTRAKRPQMTAQSAYRSDPHKTPPLSDETTGNPKWNLSGHNQRFVALGRYYGWKIFRFFCRVDSRSSVCFF
jgi:hypothetical protein